MFHPTDSDKLWFHFHLVQNIFKFLLRFLVWPTCYLKVCCLISMYFGIFPIVFLFLISSLNPLWSENRHCVNSILLEKMCILLLLDEVAYICQLYLIDWWSYWIQLCPYWFSSCWIFPFLRKEFSLDLKYGCKILLRNMLVVHNGILIFIIPFKFHPLP